MEKKGKRLGQKATEKTQKTGVNKKKNMPTQQKYVLNSQKRQGGNGRPFGDAGGIGVPRIKKGNGESGGGQCGADKVGIKGEKGYGGVKVELSRKKRPKKVTGGCNGGPNGSLVGELVKTKKEANSRGE